MNSNEQTADKHPSVLILGANGRLGCAAALAFANAGWRVLAQVRSTLTPELLGQVTALPLTLNDTEALVSAAQGARVVLYAVNAPYTRWEAEALPALQAGLDVAERLGAHFLLPGNVYNFGEAMPALLSEATPQQPTTRKGEIRVEMERLMAARAAAGAFSASVVRAGDFFGAGSGSWLDLAIVKSIGSGKLVYPGPLDVAHAWAYLPDLARAFVAVAAQRPTKPFSVWHFEGHTLTGKELLAGLEAAALELGMAPQRGFRHGGMPWGFIRAMGWVVPQWRELAHMAYLWRVPHGLDGRRLAAGPGASLRATPLAVALKEALRALKGMPLAAMPRAAA